MADILPFRKPKPGPQDKQSTLCREGHHRWRVVKDSQFDVKQGRLVTTYTCTRCGISKNKAV